MKEKKQYDHVLYENIISEVFLCDLMRFLTIILWIFQKCEDLYFPDEEYEFQRN